MRVILLLSKSGDKSINFLIGKAPSKSYTISLYLNILYLFLSVIISIALFEGGFVIAENQISHLDNLVHNPIGLWVFKFGFLLSGIWFIPSALHIMHQMMEYNKFFGIICGIFYSMAGIGLIIVALFPTRVNYAMHIIGAVVGFGFLIFATLISLIIYFIKLIKSFSFRTLIIGLIFYLPLIIVVIIGIIDAGIPFLQSLSEGIPFGDYVPPNFEIYEWGMFFTGLFTTIGTHLLFVHKK